MGNTEAVTEFRRRRKDNLIKVMGSKCCLCGYDKCTGALEFHHINPQDKSYAISSTGNCHKIEDDLNEIKKCLLICANCHREVHLTDSYKDKDLFQYQIYDENFANELIKSTKAEQYFCKECGNPITRFSSSGLCVSCAQTSRYNHRVSDKPSRDELKALIRKEPFTTIADIYGVTDNAIRKWCDKEHLPRTKKEIEKYTDAQWAEI